MEEDSWTKDETPYVVFPCRKCGQFMYAKTTQKTKKCLRSRCGRSHKVNTIIHSGTVVKGMTEAVNMVKSKQNELALNQLGTHPDFKTGSEFQVDTNYNFSSMKKDYIDIEIEERFKEMISDLSKIYKEFPPYTIEIFAENHDIPSSELKTLTRKFLREGFLVHTKNRSFKLKVD